MVRQGCGPRGLPGRDGTEGGLCSECSPARPGVQGRVQAGRHAAALPSRLTGLPGPPVSRGAMTASPGHAHLAARFTRPGAVLRLLVAPCLAAASWPLRGRVTAAGRARYKVRRVDSPHVYLCATVPMFIQSGFPQIFNKD